MAKLHCLGGSQEVGRSAFLLETDKRLLLDYGIKVFDATGQPRFPAPFDGNADAVLLSHAHLDHSGFIPSLQKGQRMRWFATPPTKDICEILWKDSMKIMADRLPYGAQEYKQALRNWMPVSYGNKMQLGQTQYRFLDAGHICGSSLIELIHDKKAIVYTGDFKMEESRMHKGAKAVEDVDTVIIDSTYALKEHPDRKALEQRLADEIEDVISEGGNMLLPAFSLGRTQELISIVRAYNPNVPIFVDGMGKAITSIYSKYHKYIRDPGKFRRDVSTVRMVNGPFDRREATRYPSVIITSAGMMEGGPILNYLVNTNAQSKLIFTGYNVEGCNGWKMLNKGFVTINGRDLEVALPAEYLDFSAHAGKSDIMNFIKWANPSKVVVVHTDSGPAFEQELKENYGFDAVAPKIGDVIEL